MEKTPVTRIAIVGAESTGKSTLAHYLAKELNSNLVPEYAREYCDKLQAPPTLEDVKLIAQKQIEQYDNASATTIFDAPLVTSIIWLYDKFNRIDLNLHNHFLSQEFDFILLCEPDIPWVYDPQRTDAHRRHEIHQLYKHYLISNNKNYHLISGSEDKRIESVIMICKPLH